MQPALSRSQLWAIYLGNLFEHYDTALFGLLTPFLASLFFPTQDPLIALILTYAMMPLGILSRPLGSLVLGYIGDNYGRRAALFLSLLGMSLITGLIAILPTYAQVGILAPLLLSFGKVLQNFFAAGEIMGGAIFILEQSSPKQQNLISSLYNASTIGGILLASGGVTLLSYGGNIEQGWRWLYLLGMVTGLIGFFLRQKETPFETLKTVGAQTKSSWITNMRQAFKQGYAALFAIILISGLSYANYSIALVLMNGFIPLITTISKAQIMTINTLLLILDFCLLPFFGFLANRFSYQKMMIGAALCIVIGGIPLFTLLPGATLLTVICVRTCFVFIGVGFGSTLHAWSQHLVPAAYRYTVISLGYAIGSQMLGAPTTAISLWMFHKTGWAVSAAWYWIGLALIALPLLVILNQKEKNTDLVKARIL